MVTRILSVSFALLCGTTSLRAVTELPSLLQSGKPLYGLKQSVGDGEVYRFEVPEGATQVVIQTAGGTGDCSLYVRRGAHPTDEKFDRMSDLSSTREKITLLNPGQGTWYALVKAVDPFVGVRLSVNVAVPARYAATPRLTPAPGTFPRQTKVFLRTSNSWAVIRYTVDGSAPTKASLRYTKPIALVATTPVRAIAFLPNGSQSPEISGNYVIEPAGTVNEVTSGTPELSRGGAINSDSLFSIDVPEGQKSLRFLTGGGEGNSELFIRNGSAPTPKIFDGRSNQMRNASSIVIADPQPGKWFALLRGRSSFWGAHLLAATLGPKPDLVPWRDTLKPYVSENETFYPSDCEVIEGMIVAGKRRLLRFSTESRNLGGGDLVLGRPEDHPELFEFQECHGHYHFKGFAAYRLLTTTGEVAATGKKVSFCLEDVRRWDIQGPPLSKYDCESQGIQTGWSDIYDAGLPGQWVDITGVAPGDYILEVTVNPDHVLDEADYSNNSVQVPVTIPPAP